MKFKMNENVVLVARPGVVGGVTGRTEKLGEMPEYRVNFGGGNHHWHREDYLASTEPQASPGPVSEEPLYAKKLRCLTHDHRLAIFAATGTNWDNFKLTVNRLVTDAEAQRVG